MEELIEEILIRIPPDEPAYLFRAALVCKPWRRILIDPSFLRRYHAFHLRRPPLLGFFCNVWDNNHYVHRPSFVPMAAAFPSLHHHHHKWRIVDCRHGRVLLENMHGNTISVWDPISDDWQELPECNVLSCEYDCLAVLCAIAGCDHNDCRGGPFLVVYLSTLDDIDDTMFDACVYSSEARAWGTVVSSYWLKKGCHFSIHRRATLIGGEIYCVFTPGVNILKYDLVKHCISLLWVSSPSICSEASHNVGKDPVLTPNEDGSLGLASISDSRLYLWSSRMVNHVVEWIQERVIELGEILPIEMNKHSGQVHVSGFAEGVGILFISTRVGTFTFELKSGRVRKITASRDFTAFPFISFITPSKATEHSATSAEPAVKKLIYVDSPNIKGDCSSN